MTENISAKNGPGSLHEPEQMPGQKRRVLADMSDRIKLTNDHATVMSRMVVNFDRIWGFESKRDSRIGRLGQWVTRLQYRARRRDS